MPRRCRVGARLSMHRMILDYVLQDVPYLGARRFSTMRLAALDVMGNALLDQALHDEGLEQLQRHILGQAALIQLEAQGRRR